MEALCVLILRRGLVRCDLSQLPCVPVKPAALAKALASALGNSRRRYSQLQKMLPIREVFPAGTSPD